jgi:NADPH2:quinone reductase
MKALMCHRFGPIDQLTVEDVPSPTPGPGEVLIDVQAASINFPDVLIVQGLYQIKPSLPFSPGAELAGVVSAVGPEVRHLAVGDRVFASVGTGGFAEQCVAPALRVQKLPADMDFETGASFVLVYGTSLHALQTIARLQPGETLLVLGAAGGVGIAAVEIAKAMGARVIAAASSPAKLELARSAGADATVDYTQPDWRREVEALTGGRGADVVYDAVGGSYTEAGPCAPTAWRGPLPGGGFFAAGGHSQDSRSNLALLKERAILGRVSGAPRCSVNPASCWRT